MKKLRVGIVGPCASGKSTLSAASELKDYDIRHIAQEHSYVPDMWKKISKPDVLIYLHVSYALSVSRKKLDWTRKEYDEQIFRLRHARQHADLNIDTDICSIDEVLNLVLEFLQSLSRNPG